VKVTALAEDLLHQLI